MGPLDQSERASPRRFRRFPCDRGILVSYRTNDHQEMIYGRCTTISEGGLGAVVDGHLRPDQVVNIEVSLERTPKPLYLNARVRYNQGFNHGFEFIAPDPLYRQVIREAFSF